MSRVILWTIVGIVVVLGLIFVVKTRKQAATMSGVSLPLKDEAYESFVKRFERRIAKIQETAEQTKSAIAKPTPEVQKMINDLDAKLQEFSTTVSEMRNKTTSQEREETVKSVRQLYRDIKKLIRDLGGSVGASEEGGG